MREIEREREQQRKLKQQDSRQGLAEDDFDDYDDEQDDFSKPLDSE